MSARERIADRGIEYLMIGGLIVIVLVTLFAYLNSTPGVHEWQGGSGPDTRCTYDTRNESRTSSDGKTYTVPVLYTVCRDAR